MHGPKFELQTPYYFYRSLLSRERRYARFLEQSWFSFLILRKEIWEGANRLRFSIVQAFLKKVYRCWLSWERFLSLSLSLVTFLIVLAGNSSLIFNATYWRSTHAEVFIIPHQLMQIFTCKIPIWGYTGRVTRYKRQHVWFRWWFLSVSSATITWIIGLL